MQRASGSARVTGMGMGAWVNAREILERVVAHFPRAPQRGTDVRCVASKMLDAVWHVNICG